MGRIKWGWDDSTQNGAQSGRDCWGLGRGWREFGRGKLKSDYLKFGRWRPNWAGRIYIYFVVKRITDDWNSPMGLFFMFRPRTNVFAWPANWALWHTLCGAIKWCRIIHSQKWLGGQISVSSPLSLPLSICTKHLPHFWHFAPLFPLSS